MASRRPKKRPENGGGAATPRFFATPARFRAWLEKNHAAASELLVGFWKVDSGKPSMTWSQSVDEALCFGWIDGVRRGIDQHAYTIRFTPRRPGSIWSAINVEKVEKLRRDGLMQPAGEKAFALRRDDRTGVYSFERDEPAVFDGNYAEQLRANRAAATFWDSQPAGYRKVATHWVLSAKRADTRDRRFAELLDDCVAGRRIKLLTRVRP